MNEPRDLSDVSPPAEYDPPRVERAMDAAELGRESHYAGVPIPLSDLPTDFTGETQIP